MDWVSIKGEDGRIKGIKRLPGWYIGSKSRLLQWIWSCIQKRGFKFDSVCDGFAGSSCVGFFFKQLGKRVVSVDMLTYAYQIAKALIENNSVKVDGRDRMLIFNGQKQATLMEDIMGGSMLREKEARFFDELRAGIDLLDDEYKKALCYYAAIMALYSHAAYGQLQIPRPGTARNRYVKAERLKLFSMKWEFIQKLMEANRLIFDNGKENKVMQGDTIELVKDIKVDLVYWDPPYADASNDYEATYRLLEYFVTYKETQKRNTPFMGKGLQGFDQLFENAKHIPIWILAYYENPALPHTKIAELMRKYRNRVEIESKEVNYPSRTGRTRDRKAIEIMIIGW